MSNQYVEARKATKKAQRYAVANELGMGPESEDMRTGLWWEKQFTNAAEIWHGNKRFHLSRDKKSNTWIVLGTSTSPTFGWSL